MTAQSSKAKTVAQLRADHPTISGTKIKAAVRNLEHRGFGMAEIDRRVRKAAENGEFDGTDGPQHKDPTAEEGISRAIDKLSNKENELLGIYAGHMAPKSRLKRQAA